MESHRNQSHRYNDDVAVVRRMALDLGLPTHVVECPIVREPDGLALSSRNVHLQADDRVASAVLYLASDEASFMTGHAMPVDGGLIAQ